MVGGRSDLRDGTNSVLCRISPEESRPDNAGQGGAQEVTESDDGSPEKGSSHTTPITLHNCIMLV